MTLCAPATRNARSRPSTPSPSRNSPLPVLQAERTAQSTPRAVASAEDGGAGSPAVGSGAPSLHVWSKTAIGLPLPVMPTLPSGKLDSSNGALPA